MSPLLEEGTSPPLLSRPHYIDRGLQAVSQHGLSHHSLCSGRASTASQGYHDALEPARARR